MTTAVPCTCGRVRGGSCFHCWLATQPAAQYTPTPVAQTVAANSVTRSLPILPPCPYRGPATGAVAECPSCDPAMKVRLKLFACEVYGTCTAAKKVAGHGCCEGCLDRLRPASLAGLPPRRLTEVSQIGLVRGDRGAINASIRPHGAGYLMAYRAGVNHARIHVAELDAEYGVIRSVPLDLTHPRGSHSQEDPRLADRPDGGLRVWFYGYEKNGDHTTMLYADLDADLRAGPVRHPELHGRTYPKEKNWSPFVHDGQQYAVYTVGPRHLMVRINGDRAETVYVSDTAFPWSGGHLRGGAPPVLVGDRYYHWFHGCATPGTDRPSGGSADQCHYNVGLYTFEPRPPFRVLSMTTHPLLWGSRHDNVTRDHCPYHAVAFPCGAWLDGDTWRVSMGWNDRRIMVAEWAAADVESALVAAADPIGTRRGRPPQSREGPVADLPVGGPRAE